MESRYFEDWKVGESIETLGRTIGDADITQFITLCGMFEELFMSQEYIEKKSIYPRRFAPGALTFAYAEGLIILSGAIHGVGLALISVDKLTLKRPLFVGDTMRVRVDVTETRATKRPDRGVVTFLHTVLNQDNEVVMECTVQRMLRRRHEAPAA